MAAFRSIPSALLVGGASVLLAGCDMAAPEVSDQRPPTSNSSSSLPRHQAAFLRRVRAADPQAQTIDRAIFNRQNELGVILHHTVSMEKIPPLMKTLLAQMAREFPRQDLTIIAYAPSNPPRTIGTARLNAATRDMTYTPAR